MEGTFWKIIGEYGLAGGIFVLLFFVLKWILEEVKKILERESRERTEWAEIIRGFQNALSEHTANAQSFHEEVKEAHRYQREEHIKFGESQNKVCQSLGEVEKALGRINGYTNGHH